MSHQRYWRACNALQDQHYRHRSFVSVRLAPTPPEAAGLPSSVLLSRAWSSQSCPQASLTQNPPPAGSAQLPSRQQQPPGGAAAPPQRRCRRVCVRERRGRACGSLCLCCSAAVSRSVSACVQQQGVQPQGGRVPPVGGCACVRSRQRHALCLVPMGACVRSPVSGVCPHGRVCLHHS